MKHVRKADLKKLLAQYYSLFVEPMPIEQILNSQNDIQIEINSIFAYIVDSSGKSIRSTKEANLKEFAKQIDELTFGNLKVSYFKCMQAGDKCNSWVYIGIAYEVID